jgi:hypothetical protein
MAACLSQTSDSKKMSIRYLWLAFVLSLLGCATPAAEESSYNKGVHAYQSKDYASARVHWKQAIAKGDSSAENNLGYLLFYGLGGNVDTQQALTLWRKAAASGHPEAQWHLGTIYDKGHAVPQSYVEAYAWYRCSIVSAESGRDDQESADQSIAMDARKSLEQLLSKLNKEQFEAAESLANRYVQTYAKHGN